MITAENVSRCFSFFHTSLPAESPLNPGDPEAESLSVWSDVGNPSTELLTESNFRGAYIISGSRTRTIQRVQLLIVRRKAGQYCRKCRQLWNTPRATSNIPSSSAARCTTHRLSADTRTRLLREDPAPTNWVLRKSSATSTNHSVVSPRGRNQYAVVLIGRWYLTSHVRHFGFEVTFSAFNNLFKTKAIIYISVQPVVQRVRF